MECKYMGGGGGGGGRCQFSAIFSIYSFSFRIKVKFNFIIIDPIYSPNKKIHVPYRRSPALGYHVKWVEVISDHIVTGNHIMSPIYNFSFVKGIPFIYFDTLFHCLF